MPQALRSAAAAAAAATTDTPAGGGDIDPSTSLRSACMCAHLHPSPPSPPPSLLGLRLRLPMTAPSPPLTGCRQRERPICWFRLSQRARACPLPACTETDRALDHYGPVTTDLRLCPSSRQAGYSGRTPRPRRGLGLARRREGSGPAGRPTLLSRRDHGVIGSHGRCPGHAVRSQGRACDRLLRHPVGAGRSESLAPKKASTVGVYNRPPASPPRVSAGPRPFLSPIFARCARQTRGVWALSTSPSDVLSARCACLSGSRAGEPCGATARPVGARS